MAILSGSICLSDIPREQMKKIKCKDGVERIYVNVAVIERREKSQFGPISAGTSKSLYLRIHHPPQRI